LAPAAGSHSFVRVTFTGGRLAATAAKIPAGTVTIVVRNAGRAPLRVVVGRGRNPAPLAMMARGTARKVWALPRGSARRVTLRLAGGERGYVCRVVRRRRANCLDFRVLASTKPAANTAPETGSPRETPVQETSPAPQPWPTPAAESPAPAAPPPAPASPAAPPAQTPPPAPANGKVFFTATCGGCHTLADAGTTGKVGPNLDKESPNASKVRDQVLSGGGGMPSFRNVFTPVEIDLIARYVDSVT
jgi:mono/diheme cytochrome c family protein